ncbi:oxygen-dependent tRNA uridine(34) hydroxylase TrhO [Lyticum sinuosum]|uniref:tRNA uridine(34) hydroxylase n=1 Tax=Lyticum sinuosum TaxID=1332059 RepID=A0AAE5AHZ1_9RICK|nr:rhodanese-like domain-containing protein [Lyticum sinuosum]MDZ5761359.1 Rhodanese Homology Domain [Lyticum sinuosum]
MYRIISFYKICPIDKIENLQNELKSYCNSKNIKGTILLAEEGINGALAGLPNDVISVENFINKNYPNLGDIEYKASFADFIPFSKMKVKIKNVVLSFRNPQNSNEMVVSGNSDYERGEYLNNEEWDEMINNPEAIIIDTRNEYEFIVGYFKNAINPGIKNFSGLIEWIDKNLIQQKDKPICMYCTGGIRCEKSTAYMKKLGFSKVYHLKGGIIKYLENKIQEQKTINNWIGNLFVFDDRVLIDKNLSPMQLYSLKS